MGKQTAATNPFPAFPSFTPVQGWHCPLSQLVLKGGCLPNDRNKLVKQEQVA